MEYDIKSLAKSIKKTHKFGYTPKYAKSFQTHVSQKAFISLSQQTIEALNWEVVFVAENSIEAKRGVKNWGLNGYDYTEFIKISYEYGNVNVYSESLKSIFWDYGMNSKRVELFILLFEEIAQSYDATSLRELEKEQDKKNNWDDYVIPATLPLPGKYRKPKLAIPIVGMLLTALTLGFILAILSVKGIYVVFLFESLIAIALTIVLKLWIKWSNVTNFQLLKYILFGAVFITFLSNEVFQYFIRIQEVGMQDMTFLGFISLKLSYGLEFKTSNLGALGWIILWIVQLGLTGLICWLRLFGLVTNYQLSKIPVEVFEFTAYMFVKGKEEWEVRAALSEYGWTDEEQQNEVFESIGAYNTQIDMQRIT